MVTMDASSCTNRSYNDGLLGGGSMIRLEDKVVIHAPPQAIATWLQRLPNNYKLWHPEDHLEFDIISGEKNLQEGSVARSVERLGNFTLAFTFKITRVEAEREVWWRAVFPYILLNLRGKFILKNLGDATELLSIIYYGWPIPIVGKCLDWFIDRLYLKNSIIIRHMHEEGEYLKAAIEAENSYRSHDFGK